MQKRVNEIRSLALKYDTLIEEARKLELIKLSFRQNGYEDMAEYIEKSIPAILKLAKSATMPEIFISDILK